MNCEIPDLALARSFKVQMLESRKLVSWNPRCEAEAQLGARVFHVEQSNCAVEWEPSRENIGSGDAERRSTWNTPKVPRRFSLQKLLFHVKHLASLRRLC